MDKLFSKYFFRQMGHQFRCYEFQGQVNIRFNTSVQVFFPKLWTYYCHDFPLQDCSHVSKTREEFYSVRCTVADMKSLYVRLLFSVVIVLVIQSHAQTESQVEASWKLGSTCDSVWPGLVCTCVDLRWLALTLVDIKFARKSKQVFSLFGHPTGVNTSWVTSINLLLANEIEDSRLEIYFFVTSVYLRGNLRVRLATRPKSLRKFNLRPLATTCRFVWPGLYSFGQVRATMLRSGMLTSWILNTRHVATHHNRVAKRAQHVAPNNVVAFKFCDRLAGACKCWANNVGICCIEVLLSFGRGLT